MPPVAHAPGRFMNRSLPRPPAVVLLITSARLLAALYHPHGGVQSRFPDLYRIAGNSPGRRQYQINISHHNQSIVFEHFTQSPAPAGTIWCAYTPTVYQGVVIVYKYTPAVYKGAAIVYKGGGTVYTYTTAVYAGGGGVYRYTIAVAAGGTGVYRYPVAVAPGAAIVYMYPTADAGVVAGIARHKYPYCRVLRSEPLAISLPYPGITGRTGAMGDSRANCGGAACTVRQSPEPFRQSLRC